MGVGVCVSTTQAHKSASFQNKQLKFYVNENFCTQRGGSKKEVEILVCVESGLS